MWLRIGVTSDGYDYHESVLSFTDDVLVVIENADIMIRNEIRKCFELKRVDRIA